MSLPAWSSLTAWVLGLVLVIAIQLPSAADARNRPPRVEEQTYQEPALGIAFPAYEMVFCQTGCAIFDVRAGERFVSVEATDALGLDVALAIFPWDGAATGGRFERHDRCTTTGQPLRLPRWAGKVWVEALIGPCHDGTLATASQGTIAATFWR